MDEGKESRIRYRVIFSVLLIILIVLVSVLGYYRLPLIIEKFSLMDCYYTGIVPARGKDYYRTVDLRYEGQIICR